MIETKLLLKQPHELNLWMLLFWPTAFFIAGDTTAQQDPVPAIGAPGESPTGPMPPQQLLAASWLKALSLNGGTSLNALKVQWSIPLQLTDIGDVPFYNNLLRAGGATDRTVLSVQIDPNDSGSVLLSISNGNDIVLPNGADDQGAPYNISLDSLIGTPPTDIFGRPYTGTAFFTIADAIQPMFATGFQEAAFLDSNGDAVQDGLMLVFNEPLSPHGSTSLAGVQLMGSNLATVHPPQLVNFRDGERVIAFTGASSLLPAIDDASLTSIDVDGDNFIAPIEVNNAIVYTYNPFLLDWDGDGILFPADVDEALAGGDDAGLMRVLFQHNNIADTSGNAPQGVINAIARIDRMPPRLLSALFATGDNVIALHQSLSEKDGAPDDSETNDIAGLVFSEPIDPHSQLLLNESKFRFGTLPNDSFSPGDFIGLAGDELNVVALVDFSAAGFSPDDSMTILLGSGVGDVNGNDLPPVASIPVSDITAPYIPLINDRNGHVVHAAFLIDDNSDGIAERIELHFTQALDPATVQLTDFIIEGVPPGSFSVTVNGDIITLTLPPLAIGINEFVNITYLGASDTTPIAAINGNFVDPLNDTFTAREILLFCEGDLNGDGIVDIFDLATLIGFWGTAEPAPVDINGDGAINVFDLATLLGNWGNCP